MAIRIGTCSWTDPELIRAGTFYPPGTNSSEARLRFYSSVFPVVEVDSSYYAIPARHTSELWVQRTPRDFLFDVKAFRLLTMHWTEPRFLSRELRTLAPETKRRFYWDDASRELREAVMAEFTEALKPLHNAGKLGLVLLQFPHWVMPRSRVKRHILSMQEALEPYKVAVEFRNRYWLLEDRVEDTLSWLRFNNLAFVCVDEPQGFHSSVPPIVDVTAEDAYVRFHGRNSETWEKRGASAADRFDWRYTPQELGEWVPRIDFLAEHASTAHVLFNTNRSDQGPYNALLLGDMLGEGIDNTAGSASEARSRLGVRRI